MADSMPGMTLTRSPKLDRCRLLLPLTLTATGRRHARVLKDLGQLLLVLGRMKSAIKGSILDFPAKPLLETPHLRHHDLPLLLSLGENLVVADEARRVFHYQRQMSKLHRLAGLAALEQLRLRLEDAEQLLVVGHILSLQHAAPAVPHTCSVSRQ